MSIRRDSLNFSDTYPGLELNKVCISQIANSILNEHEPSGEDIAGFLISRIYLDIRFNFAALPQGELAQIDLPKQIITISDALAEDKNRLNFTLAHELGHLVLHGHLIGESSDKTISDTKVGFDRKEWQANYFALCILLPEHRFRTKVIELFSLYQVNRGRLFVDCQYVNQKTYNIIVHSLSNYFNVSSV